MDGKSGCEMTHYNSNKGVGYKFLLNCIRPLYWLQMFIISAVCVGCFSGSGLDVSDTRWSCEENKCVVEFFIENASHNQLLADYAIRAHRRSSVDGSDAVSNEIVGEIHETLILNPGERRKLSQQITTRRRPDNVVVSVWSK